MNTDLVIATIIRWLHIVSAIIAIGAPFYVRFALLPSATKELDPAAHERLRTAINRRWAKIVYIVITVFILTGLYNFLVQTRSGVDGHLITARWKEFPRDQQRIYHMIFGIKMLGAFVIFFLASALPGRTPAFAPIRKHAKTSLLLLLATAALVILCSNLLRSLPWVT